MKKAFPLIAAFAALLSTHVLAQSTAPQNSAQECQDVWNRIWPLAKAGQLDARYELYKSVAISHLLLPGTPRDILSQVRNIIILQIHSFGATESLADFHQSPDTYIKRLRSELPVLEPSDSHYLLCLEKSPTSDCASLAVRERLIPSFENFAKVIDTAIIQGANPCVPER